MTDSLTVTVELAGQNVEVGTAHFSRRRNVLSTSFRYSADYLGRRGAYPIDPGLALFAGSHHVAGLPAAFADCCPDRWGKNLITKQVQAEALRDGRTAPSLSDFDFLVGVSDLTRQGALRFSNAPGAAYLAPDLTVPKLVELPRLLRAADTVAQDGDDLAAIKALLDAGSGSLGGARPKASVRDGSRLLIAKFPHLSDDWDVMAWEKTALDLAELAGIAVPGRELVTIDGRSVLILERFDRDGENRLGYISAMTLVGADDGEVRDYTEVAEILPEHGSRASQDLQELWRRIAFSVAIHNTDDHLRNHGFIRENPLGWRLSPLFDVNPNPDVAAARVTGIGGSRTRADELTGLLAYAAVFDLDEADAKRVLAEVNDATADWRRVAAANGIAKSEQARFEGAFDGLREEIALTSIGAMRTLQPRLPRGVKGAGRFS